ncbi:hypothetical protein FBU59_003921 [Linderina macrospora]|uniref:Uncharacterized protein n=1 Tax=Linderina macrospora TaxID=4868 RepID=A0ACC1J7A5_9FUNG|nr:hypothetical protein FBU59_003921 [Linderina macrospora]
MADAQAEMFKYFEPTVQWNNLQLSNIHTLASWGIGTAAGVLGLTGWNGFIFFMLNWVFLSALVFFVKCQGKPAVFFKSSAMDVAVTPIMNTLLSYVLVWTLMHALVYIYD